MACQRGVVGGREYITNLRFIFIQSLSWKSGNKKKVCTSSNGAAFRVTDHLWTSCLNDTSFGYPYLWLDAGLNKPKFVQILTFNPQQHNFQLASRYTYRGADVTQFFDACQIQRTKLLIHKKKKKTTMTKTTSQEEHFRIRLFKQYLKTHYS